MERKFEYWDETLYCHHTIDHNPNAKDCTMHAHELMEIFYFIAGHGRYLVEGTEYLLHPNDILIMRNAEAHKLLIEADAPYERIAIHFAPSLFRPFDPEGRLLRPFTERPMGQFNLFSADYFQSSYALNCFNDFVFSTSSELRAHLLARLFGLLPELCDVYDRQILQKTPSWGFASQLVSYVNDHLFENFSLDSISNNFYLSRSQTNRIFQKATGSSIWKYVMVKRLLAARAMLQRGETASKACTTCGFLDYSSFYRAYKAHFHCSPSDDRRTHLSTPLYSIR